METSTRARHGRYLQSSFSSPPLCGRRWGQLKVSKWALLITQLHWPHCCPSNFSQANTLKAPWNSAYNHGPLRGSPFWMMIFVLLLHSQACQELTWASWGNLRWASRRRWNDAGARWQRTCGASQQRLFAQQQCNEIWASQPSFYCWPIGAMWHCQPAFAWGFQQWAMHPHMVFFQSRRPPDWHGRTSSRIGRATAEGSYLGWSLVRTMSSCCSRASKMPRRVSAAPRWMQRNCIAVLEQSLTVWSHGASSHNPRGNRGWLMMPMLAYNLSAPVTPTSLLFAQPCDQLSICSMHMPMEHSPSGIQRNGSQVAKTGLMLTDFIPWVETKLYAVLWPSSITNGSGQLSWLIQVCFLGLLWQSRQSIDTVALWKLCHVDLHSVWRVCILMMHMWLTGNLAKVQVNEPCKRSTPLLGTPFFRGEMPEDAELWYIFGTRSRFHSSSCSGRHPVSGARAHWAQAALPYEECRGFQQTSTRSSRQDLWHCHLLWAWCMGTSRLRWPCPYQAQTTRTHLRVDWGVASMLQSVANHHRYQTLQADRDLAARGATFSSSLRCCIVKPRSGYRRISGSVAWCPHTTAWSFCLDHPSIGVPPLGTGRQEDCPTGAASGPLCIVFTSFSVSWPTRTLVHWQYSGQLSWFTQDCLLVSLWPSRPSIDTVVWWKLCRVDLHSVWRVCILMMHMWMTGSLAKDRARSYAVHAQGTIQSWARERIEHKLLHLMKHAEDSSKLQPGAAAKIYGVANFFELGVWGRIGCGGKLRSGHMQGHVFWQPQMLH